MERRRRSASGDSTDEPAHCSRMRTTRVRAKALAISLLVLTSGFLFSPSAHATNDCTAGTNHHCYGYVKWSPPVIQGFGGASADMTTACQMLPAGSYGTQHVTSAIWFNNVAAGAWVEAGITVGKKNSPPFGYFMSPNMYSASHQPNGAYMEWYGGGLNELTYAHVRISKTSMPSSDIHVQVTMPSGSIYTKVWNSQFTGPADTLVAGTETTTSQAKTKNSHKNLKWESVNHVVRSGWEYATNGKNYHPTGSVTPPGSMYSKWNSPYDWLRTGQEPGTC